MDEETIQPPQSPMTADQSAAALSFATMLSEQQMPKMAPEEMAMEGQDASVSPESAPGDGVASEPTEDPMQAMESRIMDEIGGLKDLIEKSSPKDKNQEIEDLKSQIEAVLNESNESGE